MVSLFRGKSDMLILLNVSCLNSYQRGWGKLHFKLNNQIVAEFHTGTTRVLICLISTVNVITRRNNVLYRTVLSIFSV